MLLVKFPDHRTIGYGEGDFKGFKHIYGHGDNLGRLNWTFISIFVPPSHGGST